MPSKVDVLRWRLLEKNERGIGGTWRELFRFKHEELEQNLPVLTPDSSVLSSPPLDDIQVTWLGHASVLVQMDGLNILTDPVFSGFCGPNQFMSFKRYRPAPCSVDKLPNIDAVCISHTHYDHLDLKSVKDLNRRFGECVHWFVPMGLKSWMSNIGCKNVTELEWWEEMEFLKPKSNGNATKFVFTPTQHWCRRTLMDENKVLWGSWTVIGPKHRFFFAGDTGYCKGFKQIGKQYGPFDFAAIPIGAYKPRWFLHFQHVDPTEAVCIHEDIQSHHSLGIHWGTFPTGYEVLNGQQK